MTTAANPGGDPKGRRRRGKIEAAILIPNLILVGIGLLYLMSTKMDKGGVEPLVKTSPAAASRIARLEEALLHDPSNVSKAIELARLYQEAGEFPWSYNALRSAERAGKPDPEWRMRLALAYLDLGKNGDGLRVLERTLASCDRLKCSAPVRLKLDVFTRMARLFKERGIDARRDRVAADKALKELLKPVHVDPAKMRPKAPAESEHPAAALPAAGPAS